MSNHNFPKLKNDLFLRALNGAEVERSPRDYINEFYPTGRFEYSA